MNDIAGKDTSNLSDAEYLDIVRHHIVKRETQVIPEDMREKRRYS